MKTLRELWLKLKVRLVSGYDFRKESVGFIDLLLIKHLWKIGQR